MRGLDLEAKILSDEVGTLLTNEESRRVRVRAEVVRAEREIGDLEVSRAVNIKAAKSSALDYWK